MVINPLLHFSYLRRVNKSPNLLIGARVDLFDLHLRNVDGLSNNNIYFTHANTLFASVKYHKGLHPHWSLLSSLDIGLLSFMKENTSFAFSASQNILEKGKFSYTDNSLPSPFG